MKRRAKLLLSDLILLGFSISYSIFLASRDKCHYQILKLLQRFSWSFTWVLLHDGHMPHCDGPSVFSSHRTPLGVAPSAWDAPTSALLLDSSCYLLLLRSPLRGCGVHTVTTCLCSARCNNVPRLSPCPEGKHRICSALCCVLYISFFRMPHMKWSITNLLAKGTTSYGSTKFAYIIAILCQNCTCWNSCGNAFWSLSQTVCSPASWFLQDLGVRLEDKRLLPKKTTFRSHLQFLELKQAPTGSGLWRDPGQSVKLTWCWSWCKCFIKAQEDQVTEGSAFICHVLTGKVNNWSHVFLPFSILERRRNCSSLTLWPWNCTDQ